MADRSLNTKKITEAILGGPQQAEENQNQGLIRGELDNIRYEWNIDDPNVLRIHMKGLDIFTRVTRRFSSAGDDANSDQVMENKNLETSELFEQVFDKGVGKASKDGRSRLKIQDGEDGRMDRSIDAMTLTTSLFLSLFLCFIVSVSVLGAPRVKASRLITKWKWRSQRDTPEGQPQIIASQTLNNYVTPVGSGASQDDLSFTNLSEPASVFKYRMAFVKSNTSSE